MVRLKELRTKHSIYLSLVKRDEDDAKSGLCLPAREPLHCSSGQTAVDTKQFSKELSLKLDVSQPDACSRHSLKSSFAVTDARRTKFRLLGRQLISGDKKWGSNNLRIYGEFSHVAGYWEWTEDVLARSAEILKASSVYDAVYASLYSYDKDIHIMRAFIECWCPDTNTLQTSEGELSMSLWDLHKLGGLSIVGRIYDEAVPQYDRLRERDAAGNRKIPQTCQYLFAAYYHLTQLPSSKGKVSAQAWIQFWCRREAAYDPPSKKRKTIGRPKSTQNPNGELPPCYPDEWTSKEDELFKRIELPRELRLRTYTAAYLSCWLCLFILPESEERSIRPATFEIASLMADGTTFSIAVPVLANIYRGLNDLVISRNPAYSKSFFPAHFIYVWLAYYFNTHHDVESPPPGPLMVTYSGAQGAKAFTDGDARKLVHEGQNVNANCFILNKNKVETLSDDGHLDITKLSYLISLRSGCLPMRMNTNFHIEPYNPHRFSRQFGFCQDIPGLLIRGTNKRTAAPDEALELWRLLLFSGSLSRVLLPTYSFKWTTNTTADFKEWWKQIGATDLIENADILLRSTDADPQKLKKGHYRERERGSGLSPLARVKDDHTHNMESDVDPKHERRKRKTHGSSDEETSEAARNSSNNPLQQLDGSLVREAKTKIPFSDKLIADVPLKAHNHPLKLRVGKGKDIAKLPALEEARILKETLGISDSESSSSKTSITSKSNPCSTKPVIKKIESGVESNRFKNISDPCKSVVSFHPSLDHTDIFKQAIHEIESRLLTKLQGMTFSEINTIAPTEAEGSYQSIKYLKGNSEPLRLKVDSYIAAVKGYLVVERLAANRRANGDDDDIILQHQKLDDVKRRLGVAQTDLQMEADKISSLGDMIARLESELKQAREEKTKLHMSLRIKDESLKALETQVKDAEKHLAELEANPPVSLEEKTELKERKAKLLKMRDSLILQAKSSD